MLLLTLEAQGYANTNKWMQGGKHLYSGKMIELTVPAFMIAVLVQSIRAMRRTRPAKAAFLPEDGEQ